MDTVTHTLVGTLLAKTRLGRAGPLAPLALVAAANFPDFENLVLAFLDKPTNMIHHRSVTHAVVGLAVQIPLFAWLMHRLNLRMIRRRAAADAPGAGAGLGDAPGDQGSPTSSGRLLAAGIALAMLTHPLLDWLNTYGVRPWLPLDGTWYHGDVAFIIDPYVWLLLLGGTALAGPRTRAGTAALGVLVALLTLAVVFSAGLTPPALLPIWFGALALIAAGRWRGTLGRRHPHAVAGVAAALVLVHVAGLYVAGRTAERISRPVLTAALKPGETIRARTLSPQPADPLAWEIVAETPTAILRHTVRLGRPPTGVVRLARRLDDPLVQRVAESRAGQAWRIFARHRFAAVAARADGHTVYLLDARYGVFPPREFASFVIDVPARTAPSRPPVAGRSEAAPPTGGAPG